MRVVWVIILSFIVLTASSQRLTVSQLEQQRKAALAEIEMTNKLLQETALTARNSLNRLNLLSNQILSRRKVINLLSQEMTAIDNQVASLQREINTLGKELESKRNNYGESARNMYRKRLNSQDKLLFILSADNFSQSFRRMRYLREYANWQKQQATEIINKQTEITRKQEELAKTRQEKQNLLTERENENKKLVTEESNQKKEVQQLNKRQKELEAELKKKQQQAAALNKQIEQLIAEEIARAEAEAKAAREKAIAEGRQPATQPSEATSTERVAAVSGGYAMTKAEKELSDNFANNRGKLPFPVKGQYAIVGHFGEQQHQELKYVRTNNNGIDIQTTPGGDAYAIFNGEVTRVFVVPGYNNSVIIRHGNYLTVYSNLSQVYVKAGDKVSTRQAIGKIFTDSESANETILHFQLWKEKTKLNPTPWLDT
ncbi:peptidoglycan DD-metalloendopeptidase family protein [Parabacteroides sp. OttesenSCG-928-G07]|nr:peptidoglycan DD-metalloendopeptidase family protein [Parabacteroides sp. OttesenSCG-928-G07]